MGHRALQLISRGLLPAIPVGQEIPDTYVDSLGNKQSIDLKRLVEMGAAEKVEEPKRRAGTKNPPAKGSA